MTSRGEALRALEKKYETRLANWTLLYEQDQQNDADGRWNRAHMLQCQDALDDIRALLTTRQEVAPVADSELPGMWSASDFTGGDPDERCHAERVPVAAQEAFTTWFCLNYPGPHAIISDPNWHAPRIFRQAQWAIKQSSPAHTSEARDVLWTGWYHPDPDEKDDFMLYDAKDHRCDDCLRVHVIRAEDDAAMRQEAE